MFYFSFLAGHDCARAAGVGELFVRWNWKFVAHFRKLDEWTNNEPICSFESNVLLANIHFITTWIKCIPHPHNVNFSIKNFEFHIIFANIENWFKFKMHFYQKFSLSIYFTGKKINQSEWHNLHLIMSNLWLWTRINGNFLPIQPVSDKW